MMSERTKAKRQVLASLTAQAREIREQMVSHYMEKRDNDNAMRWAGRTLNSIIVEKFYKNEVNSEFRTFNEWKQEGFSIRQGSHGFVVWGRPLNSQKAEKGEEVSEDEEKYFPISHIFSNAQVERKAQEVAA